MNRKITKLDLAPQVLARQRTAAYARVSCGKDEMLHSLAAQVSFYSDLIQNRQGWAYAGVYADQAETGTKDNRPEFQRLIDDCRAGKIDFILKAKCAEALELAEYDPAKFKAKVASVTIPDDGVLVFAFKNGTERTLTWENPSRRESWTAEMRSAAREKFMKGEYHG